MAGEDTVRYVVQVRVIDGDMDGWRDIATVEVAPRTKRAGVIAKAFSEAGVAVPPVGTLLPLRVLDEASAAVTRVGSKARDPELVIGVEEEPS
jgi:hypothetical protein